jgi:hypothetical protein
MPMPEANPYPAERQLLEELRSLFVQLSDTDRYAVRYHLFFEQVYNQTKEHIHVECPKEQGCYFPK